MTQIPKHDLARVQQFARDFEKGSVDVVWFSPKRSTNEVIKHFRCTVSEAHSKIIKGLLMLASKDFSHSIFMMQSTYDVYGLEKYEGIDWYVKFSILNEEGEECLHQISFHPVEDALKLQDGRVLRPKE